MTAPAHLNTQKNSPADSTGILKVPTKVKEPENQVLDITGLSQHDVESLRTTDPFLYYSIPEEVRQQAPDQSVFSNSGQEKSTAVPRQTRISFEAHPTLIMEDLLSEIAAESSHEVETDGDESGGIFELLFGGSFAPTRGNPQDPLAR